MFIAKKVPKFNAFCLYFLLIIFNPLISSQSLDLDEDAKEEVFDKGCPSTLPSQPAFKATYADFFKIVKPAWKQLLAVSVINGLWDIGQVKGYQVVDKLIKAKLKGKISDEQMIRMASLLSFRCTEIMSRFMAKAPIQKHILEQSTGPFYYNLFEKVLKQSHGFFQDHSSAEISLNIEETTNEIIEVLPTLCSIFAQFITCPINAKLIYDAHKEEVAAMNSAKANGGKYYYCSPNKPWQVMATYLFTVVSSSLVTMLLPKLLQVNDAKKAIDLLPKKPIDQISSTLSSIDVVRLYNGFEKEKALLKLVCNNKKDQNSLRSKLKLSSGYIPSVISIFAIIAVGFLVSTNLDSQILSNLCMNQLSKIGETINAILLLKKIFYKLNILLAPPTVVDKPDAKDLVVKEGRIDFENVVFRYRKKDGDMFTLSIPGRLTINPGERVAFVGKTGCGKTTLVSLLCRLYDPQEGNIYIDGQDIKSVRQSDLHKNIALVSQRPQIFPRTVKDNIAYPNSEESLDNVVAASQAAEADEFISNMPEGYNSPLVGGALGLSGGQAQRLSLARCLLKDAQIFILDEATSALDSRTENDVRDNMEEKMDGKTCITIAHRYSTLRGVDRIFVFDEGQIVEVGTHAELLAKNGHYAELWNAQIDGLREVADC